jgi:hypothetical protein
LALRIGFFLWRAPARLRRTSLPALLESLQHSRTARLGGPQGSRSQVARFRGRWLRQLGFRDRNTCYMRALTLFRFLDPQDGELSIHFGVEEGPASDRLRGHAWVSLDGRILEMPDPVAAGRVREVYVFPPPKRSEPRPATLKRASEVV